MNERKILLSVLAIIILLFSLQMYRIFVLQPLSGVNEKVLQSRQLLDRLIEKDLENRSSDSLNKDELTEEYQDLLLRFPLDSDSYLFSQSLKGMALSRGLKLHQFQQGKDQEGPWLEFSLEGSSWSFFHFLHDLYQKGPLFRIRNLYVENREGILRIQIRIIPVICPEDYRAERLSLSSDYVYSAPPRNYNPSELRGLFPSPPAPPPTVGKITEETPEPVLMTEALSDTSSLIYLGRIFTQEKGEQFYFKDQRTGQILQLQPGKSDNGWFLKSTPESSSFLLEFQDQTYEVMQ